MIVRVGPFEVLAETCEALLCRREEWKTMTSCEVGVFEYQFMYINWVATSLGGLVGILGGLFVGILLLGVAVVGHQVHLARKQGNNSLKEQVRQRRQTSVMNTD